jgi:muramoyltetrapeptide carboxypeptidase
MPELIRPPALRPGDTIAIVSTSWGGAGLLPERFQRAVGALESLDYEVRVMPNAEGVSDGVRDFVSGSVEERLADLHAAFADRSIRGVLSAIGGNHCAQLLADLDFDLVAANPKVFCGYSDTTTLLHAIHARTGLVTMYGAAAIPEFGEVGGPDAEVVEQFQRVVGRPEPAGALSRVSWQSGEERQVSDPEGRPRVRVEGEPRVALRAGSASGPLLTGCLPSLRNLIGTPWQPDYRGRVLLVETPEVPYDPEWADADLTHLRNAGLLDGLAALVVGRSDGWTTEQVAMLHGCVLDAVRGFDYPVLGGVEVSHSAPLLTVPIGVRVSVDGDLTIVEPAVTG